MFLPVTPNNQTDRDPPSRKRCPSSLKKGGEWNRAPGCHDATPNGRERHEGELMQVGGWRYSITRRHSSALMSVAWSA